MGTYNELASEMNMSVRQMLISVATLSLLSTVATAQTGPTQTPLRGEYVTVKPTDVLSYNLIGLNVTNPARETIGEISDLVISNDQLAGYIISVGGFLGMGERYVVVAPKAVKVSYVEPDKKWYAVMNGTKEELKTAPEFKYDGRRKR